MQSWQAPRRQLTDVASRALKFIGFEIVTHRIRTMLSTALVLSLALAVAGPQTRVSAAAPAPQLRIVGPAGEDPPVVNEHRNIRLRVVDETGDVSVTVWKTGSPTVAKVTKKGVLKGKLYGFVTITAVTGRGEATTTAVVARVTRRHGSMGDGDSKSDSAGRIYLTSPDEQVIYRSDGVRDEIFAGTKGEAGYQDGTGQSARFHYPTGLGVDVSTNGGLYVADTDNHCIRKVGFDGRTSIATGVPQFPGRIDADVVPAGDAVFDSPKGVASFGQALFVADTRNHALYYLNGRGDEVSLLAGQPGVLGFRNGLFREASFNLPSGLAINTEGNLLAVADTGNNAVRLVRIESGGSPYLGRVSTAGVASKAGRGTPGTGFVFSAPTSVAFDSAQNVCVVDSLGASVITRAADGTEARVLLAQPGSLGRPASIVVSGTRAIIADADATSPGVAIAVVEVGAPRITSVTPSFVSESESVMGVIQGENFPPEARVVVSGHLIRDARVVSATRIEFDLEGYGRGARLVSVVTRGGVAQREIDVLPPTLDELEVGEITTFAGSESPGIGDGGRAVEATLDLRSAVAGDFGAFGDICLDGAGNAFVASPHSHRIRRIDAQSGIITTFIGLGIPKPGVDGQLTVAFGLNSPRGVAVGLNGEVYVADTGHDRVVRIDPLTLEVMTLLGTVDLPGAGTDGHPIGPDFLLSSPSSLAIDPLGNLIVSDAGNLRVLLVDVATGIVRVVAGGGPITGPPDDGSLATSRRFRVSSIDVDSSGTMAFEVETDQLGRGRVVTVDGNGRVRVVAGSGENVAFGSVGELYFTDNATKTVVRTNLVAGSRDIVAGGGRLGVLGDGGPATRAYLESSAITVDGAGNIALADSFNDRVRWIDRKSGIISTLGGSRHAALAGDAGRATSASIEGLSDIAWVDGVGLCIADRVVRGVRVVDPQSMLLATPIGNCPPDLLRGPEDGDLAFGARLDPACLGAAGAASVLFTDVSASGSSNTVWSVGSSGTLARIAGPGLDLADGIPARDANLGTISDVVRRENGDVLIVDLDSRRVRMIEHVSGIVCTIAGRISTNAEYSGEGGPAVSATLARPRAIAVAPNGEVYIADASSIRKVDKSGLIHTVSGSDVGVPGPSNSIRDTKYGLISALLFDESGNLFVADALNHVVVRLFFASDKVREVAGIPGFSGNLGDGGSAIGSEIGTPGAMAIDNKGNLYIASLAPVGPRVVRVIKGVARDFPAG